jgi:hypothetical protein
MEGDEEALNLGIAVFNNLKFLVGTGCKVGEKIFPLFTVQPVQLRFRVSVQTIEPETGKFGQKRVLESLLTEPFIAMTNTKQWVEAEGLLLANHLFSLPPKDASPRPPVREDTTDGESIGAIQFCNRLQRHYAESTNQNPNITDRMLLPSEFEFLFSRKFGKKLVLHSDGDNVLNGVDSASVTKVEFGRFWEWFGVVLQKIRYQKFLYQLWSTGLVYGFIGKEQAESLLSSAEIGTFLLRWSERSAGSIAVAYKQSASNVRHYLIQSKDTVGQGRSLPQFIRETSSLVRFLQHRVSPGSLNRSRSCIVDKEKALSKIGTKRRIERKEDEEKMYYDTEIASLVHV